MHVVVAAAVVADVDGTAAVAGSFEGASGERKPRNIWGIFYSLGIGNGFMKGRRNANREREGEKGVRRKDG